MTIFIWIIILAGCDRSFTPKPSGYVRIDYPEKSYRVYSEASQFQFEIPVYSSVEADRSPRAEPGCINIVFPHFDGKVHLSYKPVEKNLDLFITDCRTLVYKHTVKAEGIEEIPFSNLEDHRYGIVYDLKGNVASAVQFFITDSTHHFLRGSLYFNSRPNRDSLNPVIDFLRADILHMIETTEWKY